MNFGLFACKKQEPKGGEKLYGQTKIALCKEKNKRTDSLAAQQAGFPRKRAG